MMFAAALTVGVAYGASELRRDGVPVSLAAPGSLYEEFKAQSAGSYPFKPFSQEFVKRALSTPTNWTSKGAVTPVKDQGKCIFRSKFLLISMFFNYHIVPAPYFRATRLLRDLWSRGSSRGAICFAWWTPTCIVFRGGAH